MLTNIEVHHTRTRWTCDGCKMDNHNMVATKIALELRLRWGKSKHTFSMCGDCRDGLIQQLMANKLGGA